MVVFYTKTHPEKLIFTKNHIKSRFLNRKVRRETRRCDELLHIPHTKASAKA